MANYPFKINMKFKDGTTKPHYTSSFATDADTAISASAMVDKINLIPFADAYTQDNVPAAMHPSRKFGLNDEGHKWLSASYTHANTGSVIFTDTEDTDNDGLDYYTFWGTKVCNVLGLPEGIPIYTETFKLSDDSANPSNYLSGDVIADGVAIKESFKIAPQGRMRSNLVWDHQFGEGFLQWVSGSASKLIFGYNDQTDVYSLSAASAATFNISGVNIVSSSVAYAPKFTYSTDIDILGGGVTSFESTTYNRGQLHIDHYGNNTLNGYFSIRNTESQLWESSRQFSDYTLSLINRNGDETDKFTGIAFDVGTEEDSNSIAASIAVLRDSTADGNSALHDGNMIFCTNDAGDNGLTERMRITHDGNVQIGGEIIGGTRGYFDGGESGTFNSSRYLDFNNGTQMGATIGYRMHRAGSITGVSCQFNVTSQTDGYDNPMDEVYSRVRTEVRKDGSNVFYVDESPTSTGNKGDSATQARGTDTFAAGDVLTLYVTIINNGGYMGSTSAVTCDDFNAFMEVTFDT